METSWDVNTTYVVQDISEDAKYTLEDSLGAPGTKERYGFEIVSRGKEGDPFIFQLTNVRDMRALREVQQRIQKLSEFSRYPVQLSQAQLTFSSVYGNAASQITIHGTATQGATVTLDVGNDTVQVPVGLDGRWTAAITRNGQLSQRGGWVYGAIQKGSAQHFIKVNILDTRGSERILYEDLPMGSLLR